MRKLAKRFRALGIIACLLAFALTPPTAVPQSGTIEWAAFRIDLTLGPAHIQYEATAHCTGEEVCVIVDGELAEAIGEVPGSTSWVVSTGTFMVEASVMGQGIQYHETRSDPPSVQSRKNAIAQQSSQGDWFVGFVLSSSPMTFTFSVTPPEALVTYKTGSETNVVFPRDMEPLAHGMAWGVQTGVGYREQAGADEGLIGAFKPNLALDASVTSPERLIPCRNWVRAQAAGVGAGCQMTWALNGPPGAWSFDVLANAHYFGEAPVLMWADTPPL